MEKCGRFAYAIPAKMKKGIISAGIAIGVRVESKVEAIIEFNHSRPGLESVKPCGERLKKEETMQTLEQVTAKYEEMLKDCHARAIKRLEQLLNSGAIDFNHYDDDYQLPKILLHVTFDWLTWQTAPLTDDGRKKAATLKKF